MAGVSSSEDLIAFVRARLDEDEAAAMAATPGPWADTGQRDAFVEQAATHAGTPADDLHLIAEMERCDEHGDRRRADAVHIARILRGVDARREILAMWQDQPGRDLPEGVHDGRDPDERERDEALKNTLEQVVRLLAAECSDHPGYREEWKP